MLRCHARSSIAELNLRGQGPAGVLPRVMASRLLLLVTCACLASLASAESVIFTAINPFTESSVPEGSDTSKLLFFDKGVEIVVDRDDVPEGEENPCAIHNRIVPGGIPGSAQSRSRSLTQVGERIDTAGRAIQAGERQMGVLSFGGAKDGLVPSRLHHRLRLVRYSARGEEGGTSCGGHQV
jgi:hypothetical protein